MLEDSQLGKVFSWVVECWSIVVAYHSLSNLYFHHSIWTKNDHSCCFAPGWANADDVFALQREEKWIQASFCCIKLTKLVERKSLLFDTIAYLWSHTKWKPPFMYTKIIKNMIYMNLCRRVYIYTYIYILCDDIYNLHYVQYDVDIYIYLFIYL